ncbi:MAG: sensor domain-containing protein [Candidatus Dormibacteria bacterium]
MATPLRVLLVEDRPSDAELVLHQLRSAGYEVDSRIVDNEPDFAAALADPPDIILADYNVPGFDAFKTLARMKSTGLEVPLIVVSGTIGEDIAVEAIRAGAHDYLIKDRLGRLGSAVAQALEDRELRARDRQTLASLSKSEAELREQTERYQTMLDALSELGEGLVITEAGKMIYGNEAYRSLTGYTDDELKAQGNLIDLAPEELRADLLARLTERLRGDRPDSYIESQLVTKDGRVVDVESAIHMLPAETNTRILAIVRDITERKKIQAKFEGLLGAAPDALIGVRRDGSIAFVNHQAQELFGYRRDELLGRPIEILVPEKAKDIHPGHRAKYFASPKARPMGLGLDLYGRRKDGTEFPAEISLSSIETEEGLLVTAAVRDISERRAADERLRISEERFRVLVEGATDYAILTLDPEGHVTTWNAGAERIYGYKAAEVLGKPFSVFYPEADRRTGRPEVELAEAGRVGSHEDEGWRARQDETQFFAYAVITAVRNESGELLGFSNLTRDISERRQHIAELEFQALHDSLTGLPNRTLLRDRLDREILSATRQNGVCGLLIMDIDQFKEVNDTMGHEAGDILLHAFAGRIGETIRDIDTVARLGGDEFAILPVGAADIDGILATATKVLNWLEKPFVVDGTAIYARASIGIAVFPQHGSDASTLLRRADVAMYAAKQSHRGYAVYAPEQEENITRRMALLGELRQAIPKGELVLHYQPRVDVRQRRTIGFEALVRWNHPRYGLVPPAEFILVAETSDLIGPLTSWVMNQALGQLRAWDLQGIALVASVNLSAANLLDPDLATVIGRLLKTWHIPATRVILEITETTLISAGGGETLKQLRKLGLGLSIDDFGTGYASLTHLRQLPLTELKLDRSFVGTMATSGDDAAIVRPAISLGHDLGLNVSAEGVEDEATWDMLAAFKCDVVQGYYVARPMPPEQLPDWLANSGWGLADASASAPSRSKGRR